MNDIDKKMDKYLLAEEDDDNDIEKVIDAIIAFIKTLDQKTFSAAQKKMFNDILKMVDNGEEDDEESDDKDEEDYKEDVKESFGVTPKLLEKYL